MHELHELEFTFEQVNTYPNTYNLIPNTQYLKPTT